MIVLSLHKRRQDRLRFASRFNDLTLAEIFLGVVIRLEQHVLDLFVGEAVSRLDVDFSLLPTALLSRRHAQDAIGINQKLYFNSRQAGGHRWNTLQIKSRQRPAIARQFTFAL